MLSKNSFIKICKHINYDAMRLSTETETLYDKDKRTNNNQ